MQTFVIRMLLVAAIVLPGYILLRFFWKRRQSEKMKAGKNGAAREVVLAVFVLFMVGLLALVLWPASYETPTVAERLQSGWQINLVPLRNIKRFFNIYGTETFWVNIVGNVLMFVPMGFCLPLLWKRWRKFWKVLLAGVLLPVCIETVQLFVGRSVDVDDVLLNALGGAVGYGVYVLCRRVFSKTGRLAQGEKR
jgi:glycopeptide antibiotics resistance protein